MGALFSDLFLCVHAQLHTLMSVGFSCYLLGVLGCPAHVPVPSSDELIYIHLTSGD